MRTRSWFIFLAALAAPAALAGCATWRPQGLTPTAVIQQDRPRVVRVTRADSTRVVLDSPRIQGDSILGVNHGQENAVALADVAYVSLRRANTAAGAALVGVGVAAGVVALMAATWN